MEPKTFINHPEDLMSWRVNKNYVHTSIYGKLLKISSDYKSYDKTSELLPTPVMDPRSKGLCLDTISPCQQKPVRRGGRRRNPNWVFFKNLPNPISLQGIGNPWRIYLDSNHFFVKNAPNGSIWMNYFSHYAKWLPWFSAFIFKFLFQLPKPSRFGKPQRLKEKEGQLWRLARQPENLQVRLQKKR